jgi:hypothetical protein
LQEEFHLENWEVCVECNSVYLTSLFVWFGHHYFLSPHVFSRCFFRTFVRFMFRVSLAFLLQYICLQLFSTTVWHVTSVTNSFQDNPARTGQKYATGKKSFNQNGSKCDQLFQAISVKICNEFNQENSKATKPLFDHFWANPVSFRPRIFPAAQSFTRSLWSYAAEFSATWQHCKLHKFFTRILLPHWRSTMVTYTVGCVNTYYMTYL